MFKNYFNAAVSIAVILVLSACSGSAEQTSSPEPASLKPPQIVSATGKVVPEREASLSVPAGGIVEEILVNKGDAVSSGQVLIKLEPTERQIAAVSGAELELLNAQLTMDALYKDTNLLAAQAMRSAETAEKALVDLNNRELQQAEALKAVAAAQKALDSAKQKLEILTKPPSQGAIDQAQAGILLAEKNLSKTIEQIEDTQRQYKKFSSNSKLPDNFKKGILTSLRQALKGLEVKRTQEELSLSASKNRFNELLSPPDPTDVQVAEAELLTAQALLNQSEKELDRIMDGPEAGEIAILEAQIEKGKRDFEIFNAGPDPEHITISEARIRNAEAQLAAAESVITDLVLEAPFDGVISEIYVNPGELVAPGTPILLIGNLDHLRVETTDLSEIDVTQIKVGDPAVVTFDSLPDLIVPGIVTLIAPKAAEGPGVSFPVTIQLDEEPPALRWGMTAFIDFEPDQKQ